MQESLIGISCYYCNGSGKTPCCSHLSPYWAIGHHARRDGWPIVLIPWGWQPTCSLWWLQYSSGQALCCKFPFTPSIIWFKTPYHHKHSQIWQQANLIYTHNCVADNVLVKPLHTSDHYFITVNLHLATSEPPTPLSVTFRWNLCSISPSNLTSLVSSSLPSPTHFSALDVNTATDILCSTLTCLDHICSLSSRPARAARAEHRFELKAAEIKWCKSKDPSDLSIYKSLLSYFSAEVHTVKASYFFHNKTNSASDTRNIFKTFNSLLCHPLTISRKRRRLLKAFLLHRHHRGTSGYLCLHAVFRYTGLACPSSFHLPTNFFFLIVWKPFLKGGVLSWVRGSAFPPFSTRGHHHLDSIPLTLDTCLSSHSQLFSIIIYTPHSPPLCLAKSNVLLCSSSRSVPCSLRHQRCVAFCGVPLCFLFCFLPVGLLFIKNTLTCTWTQTSVLPLCLLSPFRDRKNPRTAMICSDVLVLVRILAAEFWMNCRCLMVLLGRLVRRPLE